MNGVDWTLLRSFLAVVESGSLGAAASRTGASQPTLSRHIRDLEQALDVSLFTRTPHGLDPTEAGLSLMDDARAMGAAAESLMLKAHGRSQRLSGTVRITASVIVANLLLPSMLAELRQREPDIDIELIASDLSQNLLRRDADLAIRMADPTQNALIARRLGETRIGLFGTRSYLRRRGRPARRADLLDHDVIGYDRSDQLIRGLAASGLVASRDDFALRCDDKLVTWHLLLAGAGLGFAQTLLARRHPELDQLDIGLAIPPLPVWLVMHEDVRTNARVRRVADFLGGALRDFLVDG
ncbi:LysR family transcriptional regulator [Aurantiacibacter flavus]|uniref:LysR family transcriptional regulator n=1 Tax=Aurantiacibacter flavus TaxID=3145232 RepID=A0ABV0D019_9SPHN